MLIITPLDIDKLLNNLEHHRISHYRRRGARVTVVYKTMNQSMRFRDLLRNTLAFSTKERSDGDARLIAVDPPFNYFAGYRRNAEASVTDDGRKRSLRMVLIRVLSPLSFLRDIFATPSLFLAAWRSLRRDRCDVCFGFGPWGALAGLMLRRIGKVGTLVCEDRDYEAGLVPDRLRQWYTRVTERFVIRRADVTISISHLLSDLRRDELAMETHVIPSGVDWERFAAARASVSSRRALIYVGNVISWSGLDHAIAAMPRIREAFPDATLVVVGSGTPNYVAHLQRLASQELPEGTVRFLGHREPDDLAGLLAEARIGLANSQPVPFRRYATPLKVIEYMAAGLPVLATEDTEAGIIVTRHDCGAAIPFDPGALAGAVIRLLGDDELYLRQRENAIRHSREYDWDRLLSREQELVTGCRRG